MEDNTKSTPYWNSLAVQIIKVSQHIRDSVKSFRRKL